MTQLKTAPGRGYSKLSQIPVKEIRTARKSSPPRENGTRTTLNLVDLQRVLYYTDNRSGRRRIPEAFHSWFSNSKILRGRKRPRNGSFDLVGIESNPGPVYGPVTQQQHLQQQKKKKRKGAPQKQVSKKPSILRSPDQTKSSSSKSGQKITYATTGMSPHARDYLRTVLAPCSGNARIPDMNCMPTSLVTLTLEGTTTASAGGVCGLVFDVKAAAGIFLENTSTTTDATFTYNAITNFAAKSAFEAAYGFVRPVSACVDFMYTGATLSDSGLITAWTCGTFGTGTSETGPTSLTGAFAMRSSDTNRLREGMSVIYRPGDSSSFFFTPSNATALYGVLGLHVSGAAAAAPFTYRITINFEVLPKSDSNSATPTGSSESSPVDPTGHGKAVAVIAKTKPFSTVDAANRLSEKARLSYQTGKLVWEVATAASAIGALLW